MIDKLKHENVLHVLVNHANSSNKESERQLAKLLLANFHQIPDLSIERLAELCYVSQPTLTRFIMKLGYINYAQFKKYISDLVIEISNETANDLFDVDPHNIIESHYQEVQSSLAATQSKLVASQLIAAAGAIKKAKRVVVIGIDYSQIVAFDAQLRFMRYQKVFETAVTATEQLELIKSLSSEDLLIVLSVSGETIGLQRVTDCLGDDVECLLITSNQHPLILQNHKRLEIINISKQADQKTNTSQSGRINLLFAIDTLYIKYGNLYHNQH